MRICCRSASARIMLERAPGREMWRKWDDGAGECFGKCASIFHAGAAGVQRRAYSRGFSILHQKIHGHPLVYLDNAATSQKPRQVIDAITRYYERDNANIHRGVHYLSEKATEDYENSRKTIQEFINAGDSREIIFVRSTTEAINLVAQTYARQNLKPGDEVLITAMEHHSDIVPWQMICQEKQGKLQVAPINEDGELILEEFERLLTPRTKLVAVAHLSNALGTINPIKRIVEIAHAKNVPVLVDG